MAILNNHLPQWFEQKEQAQTECTKCLLTHHISITLNGIVSFL